MTQYHRFTLEDVNNMIVFEWDLYTEMIVAKNAAEESQ